MTKLKRHIDDRGIRQADIVSATGSSSGYINDLVNGRRKPSYEMAKKIAACVGLSIEEIMDSALGASNQGGA